MNALKTIVTNRRGWTLLVPLLAYVAQQAGVPLTEDLLNSTSEQVLAGGTALFGLWSLFFPRQPAPAPVVKPAA